MAGLLDFIKTPRSDNPNRKASLAGRSQVYNLLDNIIGFNDDRVTPGEALGAGLRNDPIGLLSGAVRGVQGDLNNLMFEGGAMQRPQDVLGYAAAPMAPGAVSGRMANVLSSGGAKPTLDQMRANARQRIADRAKMVQDLTQDASPVRMKSGDLSVLVSKSPDREGWRVTYFQPDGSPSGHVDAKDKSGAVQRALEDQFTPIAARSAPTPTSTSPAQEVAGLLSSGRADEVTDEMLAKFTPKDEMEIFDLYQRGATGMDLPMDEASRMGRAGEMGSDTDMYHGTTADFQSMKKDTEFYTTPDADYANIYAGSPYDEGGRVLPLMQATSGVLDTRTPSGQAVFDDNFFMKYGGGSPLTERGVPDWTDGPDFGEMFSDNSLPYNGVFLDEGKVPLFDGSLLDRGVSTLGFDPTTIRSRFARFDPRLAHLRNLSAGVGGMGLLGMSYPQEEQY